MLATTNNIPKKAGADDTKGTADDEKLRRCKINSGGYRKSGAVNFGGNQRKHTADYAAHALSDTGRNEQNFLKEFPKPHDRRG